MIAEGAVSAANQFNKKSASLKKEVVTEAIARAAADAYVKGVQDGKGSVAANQESIGEAIAKPISRVVFSLIAVAFGSKCHCTQLNNMFHTGEAGINTFM